MTATATEEIVETTEQPATEAKTLKALSLWQPWASLIAIGAKRIETRSWSTEYRGPIAIHAAVKFDKTERELCATSPFADYLQGDHAPDKLPLGAIVAVADLVDCVHVPDFGKSSCTASVGDREGVTIPPGDPELCFGDYTPGRYAWVLDNIRALPSPIPATGRQKLFDLPDDAAASVWAAISPATEPEVYRPLEYRPLDWQKNTDLPGDEYWAAENTCGITTEDRSYIEWFWIDELSTGFEANGGKTLYSGGPVFFPSLAEAQAWCESRNRALWDERHPAPAPVKGEGEGEGSIVPAENVETPTPSPQPSPETPGESPTAPKDDAADTLKSLLKRDKQIRNLARLVDGKRAEIETQQTCVATAKSELDRERETLHKLERELQGLEDDLTALALGKPSDKLPFPEPEPKPEQPAPTATPATEALAPTETPSAPASVDPVAEWEAAWRAQRICDLAPALKPGKLKALAAAGIETMGQMADWQQAKGEWWCKDIKGFGEKGQEQYEAATARYWAEHPQPKPLTPGTPGSPPETDSDRVAADEASIAEMRDEQDAAADILTLADLGLSGIDLEAAAHPHLLVIMATGKYPAVHHLIRPEKGKGQGGTYINIGDGITPGMHILKRVWPAGSRAAKKLPAYDPLHGKHVGGTVTFEGPGGVVEEWVFGVCNEDLLVRKDEVTA